MVNQEKKDFIPLGSLKVPLKREQKWLTNYRLNLLQLTSSDPAIERVTYMDVACFKYSCKIKKIKTVRYFANWNTLWENLSLMCETIYMY